MFMAMGRISSRPNCLSRTRRAISSRRSRPGFHSTCRLAVRRARPSRRPADPADLGSAASADVAADLEDDAVLVAERGGQLLERARGHQPAFVDDDDAVAGLGDLGQDVGREDDRVARPGAT